MSAAFYFWILVGVLLALFALAYFLPRLPTKKQPDDLRRLLDVAQETLSGSGAAVYIAHHYVVIEHAGKKQALITLDCKQSQVARRLGDTLVLNFRRVPSKKRLYAALVAHKALRAH